MPCCASLTAACCLRGAAFRLPLKHAAHINKLLLILASNRGGVPRLWCLAGLMWLLPRAGAAQGEHFTAVRGQCGAGGRRCRGPRAAPLPQVPAPAQRPPPRRLPGALRGRGAARRRARVCGVPAARAPRVVRDCSVLLVETATWMPCRRLILPQAHLQIFSKVIARAATGCSWCVCPSSSIESVLRQDPGPVPGSCHIREHAWLEQLVH